MSVWPDSLEHLLALGSVLSYLLVEARDLGRLGAAPAPELSQLGRELLAHSSLAQDDRDEDEESLQHVDHVEDDPVTRKKNRR